MEISIREFFYLFFKLLGQLFEVKNGLSEKKTKVGKSVGLNLGTLDNHIKKKKRKKRTEDLKCLVSSPRWRSNL